MSQSNIKSLLSKTKPNEAYQFYKKFILSEEKLKLFKIHKFQTIGSVPSIDWELFASILVNEEASEGHGTDLTTFEVKSAKIGSSFEYQYHKFTGQEKLKKDMAVKHLFISYSKNYDKVVVRLLFPYQVREMFKKWEKALNKNYSDGSNRQRFRKSIPFGFVKNNAHIIFHIENRELKPL